MLAITSGVTSNPVISNAAAFIQSNCTGVQDAVAQVGSDVIHSLGSALEVYTPSASSPSVALIGGFMVLSFVYKSITECFGSQPGQQFEAAEGVEVPEADAIRDNGVAESSALIPYQHSETDRRRKSSSLSVHNSETQKISMRLRNLVGRWMT